MMNTQEIQSFFESTQNTSITEWLALPQSGSARRNFIATTDKKFVVTYNENTHENSVFFYFSKIFSQENLNTPTIIAVSNNQLVYVQDFLGGKTLSEVIAEEGQSLRVKNLAKQTLDRLYKLQTSTIGKVDYTRTFEYESYNQLPILSDLFYFKNFFVDVLELEYHKANLLKEFMTITAIVEALQPRGLMIRDFQSRNIMVDDQDEVFFIDYQGAMEGPLMYDVISFLFQAKANFSSNFKEEMLEYYISLFESTENHVQLRNSVKWLQLMRFLQVLGAYGFRGIIQRKSHFIASIQQGIKNIVEFVESWEEMKRFPELKTLVESFKNNKVQEKINQITQ